jgi:hypothetical protein
MFILQSNLALFLLYVAHKEHRSRRYESLFSVTCPLKFPTFKSDIIRFYQSSFLLTYWTFCLNHLPMAIASYTLSLTLTESLFALISICIDTIFHSFEDNLFRHTTLATHFYSFTQVHVIIKNPRS